MLFGGKFKFKVFKLFQDFDEYFLFTYVKYSYALQMVVLSELYPMTILIRALLCPPHATRLQRAYFRPRIGTTPGAMQRKHFNCYFHL